MTPKQKTRAHQLAADAEDAAAYARKAAASAALLSLEFARERTDRVAQLSAEARNAADEASNAAERIAAELRRMTGQADPDRPRPLTGWGFCVSCGSDALDAETGQCATCGYDPAAPNRRPRIDRAAG